MSHHINDMLLERWYIKFLEEGYSKEEALEKFNYLINNPKEIEKIAKSGQLRTLEEHTYEIRIKELIEILTKYI